MRKNNFNSCDRKDYSQGKLKTPQVLWLAYTLIYVIVASHAGRYLFFGHFFVHNAVAIIMTVIAAILCIGFLIYNHKYEEYESVKWFGYFLVFCNVFGFIFFIESAMF